MKVVDRLKELCKRRRKNVVNLENVFYGFNTNYFIVDKFFSRRNFCES